MGYLFAILLVLLTFSLFVGFSYALLLLLTIIFWNDKNRLQFKKIILIASFIIAAGVTYFFLFTRPTKNYKTAYISTSGQKFSVTVKGKRLYMFHDPVSLFFRKTYDDSATFIIPRKQGIIRGEEIPSDSGSYKGVGKIIITGSNMKIDLFADNYDDKTLDPYSWNGDYKLVWRQR